MNRYLTYGLSLAVVLSSAAWIPAFGQLYGGGESVISATPEQVEECKKLGIPEFTCTEQQILAKRRLVAAGQEGAYGSGTPMLGRGFGDMGALVGVLGAIFGGVAAAFYAMSRKRKAEAVPK